MSFNYSKFDNIQVHYLLKFKYEINKCKITFVEHKNRYKKIYQ